LHVADTAQDEGPLPRPEAPREKGAVLEFRAATKRYPGQTRPAVEGLTLTVPAGAYVVSAKTVMTALVGPQDPLGGLIQNNLAIGGRCKLDAAGDGDESLTNVVINQRQTPATLYMQLTRTVGAPSDFVLECSAGMPFRLSETSIIAQKVSNISLTNIPQ
jgi:hypothetical protein